MGYPADLLSTRAVVKPGLFAVIPKDGLVNNVLPFLTGCRTSIVASPPSSRIMLGVPPSCQSNRRAVKSQYSSRLSPL